VGESLWWLQWPVRYQNRIAVGESLWQLQWPFRYQNGMETQRVGGDGAGLTDRLLQSMYWRHGR
jgi:hypothetical protein